MSNEEISEPESERGTLPVLHLSGTELSNSLRDRQTHRTWSTEATSQNGLIGDRSGRRLWANECDFLLAVVVSMVILNVIPDFDPLLKGVSFFFFYLLYFQVTEWLGATPAKWWFGLRVRSSNGNPASFGQIAIRTLCRVVEINPIFLGLFPAAVLVLFTRRHIRLGDWLAGTVVVRIEDLN